MIILDDMAKKIQSLLNDEESMKQIQELAEMFGGGMGVESAQNNKGGCNDGNAPPKPPHSDNCSPSDSLFGSINPMAIMQLSEAFSRKDPNCDLILALKPLLSKDKQQRADRAVKMLRLYNVYTAMKESGMLSDFKL